MGDVRVLLDARFRGYPGIGRFVTELWKGLLDIGADVVATTNKREQGWLGEHGPPVPGPALSLGSRPFGLIEQASLPLTLRRSRVNVYHSPHLTVPYFTNRPVVLTIHDVFPLREPRNARSRAAGWYYRAMFPLAARKARIVVADSTFAAEDIVEVLRVPEAKLRIIELGIDQSRWNPQGADAVRRVAAKFGITRPYLLYVGTVKRHKNIPTLLDAFRSMSHKAQLVLAGPTMSEVRAVYTVADQDDRVIALGRVHDNLLPALYSGASAVALPSLYEAVGLTALEAMACGTPVVASNGGALPTTVGPGGVLVPPMDTSAWTRALEAMVTDHDLRVELANAGRAHTARRTWQHVAENYLAIYREAAN